MRFFSIIYLVISSYILTLTWSSRNFGVQVIIDYYPHVGVISIECLSPKHQRISWKCASSILNHRMLLTSAHCFDECMELIKANINYGVPLSQSKVELETFRLHAAYNSVTVDNDIALVVTKKNIQLGSDAKIVSINREPVSEISPFKRGKVAIWENGTDVTNAKENKPKLKYLTQPIISKSKCEFILNKILPKDKFCGGIPKSRTYPTLGDSGSGLMVDKQTLIGLVSMNYPTLDPSITVYTDVSRYYEWIQKESKIMLSYISKFDDMSRNQQALKDLRQTNSFKVPIVKPRKGISLSLNYKKKNYSNVIITYTK